MYRVINLNYKYHLTPRLRPPITTCNGRRIHMYMCLSVDDFDYILQLFRKQFCAKRRFPGTFCHTREMREKWWVRGLPVLTILPFYFLLLCIYCKRIYLYIRGCVFFYHRIDELYPRHVPGSCTRTCKIIIRPSRAMPASNWIRSLNHVVSKPDVYAKFTQRHENGLTAFVRQKNIDYSTDCRSTLFVPECCDPR